MRVNLALLLVLTRLYEQREGTLPDAGGIIGEALAPASGRTSGPGTHSAVRSVASVEHCVEGDRCIAWAFDVQEVSVAHGFLHSLQMGEELG